MWLCEVQWGVYRSLKKTVWRPTGSSEHLTKQTERLNNLDRAGTSTETPQRDEASRTWRSEWSWYAELTSRRGPGGLDCWGRAGVDAVSHWQSGDDLNTAETRNCITQTGHKLCRSLSQTIRSSQRRAARNTERLQNHTDEPETWSMCATLSIPHPAELRHRVFSPFSLFLSFFSPPSGLMETTCCDISAWTAARRETPQRSPKYIVEEQPRSAQFTFGITSS